MDRWRERTVLRLTLVLLTAAFLLMGAGAAGLGGSVALSIGFIVLGNGLYVLRRYAAESPLGEIDRDRFHADLWIGPELAALVTLLWLDATPGELQALGGLVGLAGMANYFLRPVYHLTYGLARRLVRA